MHVIHVTEDRNKDWDSLAVREPSFSLLQSWAWGEFKASLGWIVFRIAVEEHDRLIAGAQMLIRLLPMRIASVAYVPRGPIGCWTDEAVSDLLFAEMHRVARLHKAVFMKIEPPVSQDRTTGQLLQCHQFTPSPYANQPRATIILDLRSDLDAVVGQMRKRTREYIRYSSRNGVTMRRGGFDDIPAFYNLMRITGKRGHFPTRSLEYYQREWQTFSNCNQVALLLAYSQDQLLAGHMAFSLGDHAAYFHGGSLDECGHLRPNYLLVWEAVKWAKESGCTTYDLWGVPDEVGQSVIEGNDPPVSDRTDGLWGVYRFKSGFSKNIVYYAGAYDYVYRPGLYTLMTNRYFNSETMDQFSVLMDFFKH